MDTFYIVGHDGFRQAMITRGGVSLKEIEQKTMQSKIVTRFIFCGELVDIDGPVVDTIFNGLFSSGF